MRACLSGWISLSVSVAAWGQCPPDWSRAFLRLDFESGGFNSSILKPLRYGGRDQLLIGFTRTGMPGGLFGLTLGGPFLWDGSTITALGQGIQEFGANINDAVIWIDPETKQETLIVAGSFTSVGDIPARYVAQWNGAAWTTVGNSVDFATTNFVVRALEVYDDGQGPALYAGGDFSKIGGVNASRIARWTGGAWEPVGPGVSSRVFALQTFDDGSGAKLFAGGEFTLAGGTPAPYIARWDGSAWTSTSSGPLGRAADFEVVEEAGVSVLYAAGSFGTGVGGQYARLARWTGDSWLTVGASMNGEIFDLFPYVDRGNQTFLIAGNLALAPAGTPAPAAILRNGAWVPVPSLNSLHNPIVSSFATISDPATGDPLLLFAGRITSNNRALGFASSAEDPVHEVLGLGLHEPPLAMASIDDGLNPGRKTVYADGVTRLVEGKWETLPRYPDRQPRDLIVAAPGGGPPLLFAAGDFGRILGSGGPQAPVEGFAAFDGADWFVPGGGFTGYATSLAADAQDTVYIGAMVEAGDEHEPTVFAWNGASLIELPGLQTDGSIRDLVFFDSGDGERLYAIGQRMVNGEPVARWTGAAWESVSTGSTSSRHRGVVVQEQGGPALYLSAFSTFLMRFDGAVWSAIDLRDANPEGWLCYVTDLAAFDDGFGERLFLSGEINDGTYPRPSFIARLDHGQLTFLALGDDFVAYHGTDDAYWPEAERLFAFTDGEFGPDTLLLSGDFTSVAGIGAHTLAGWRAAYPLPGDINGDNVVGMADLMGVVDAFNTTAGDPAFNPDADLDDNGSVDFADLNVVISAFNSAC